MAEKDYSKPSKFWRSILVISLALNLAIVGLVAGFSYRSGVVGKPPQRFDVGLGPIGQALTRDQRRAIGGHLRENAQLTRQSHRDTLQTLQNLAGILTQDPLDTGALRGVLDASSSQAQTIQTAARAALLQEIEAMSFEDRKNFAARILENSQRRRRN